MSSLELSEVHKKIMIQLNEVVTQFSAQDKINKDSILKLSKEISDLSVKLTALTIAFHEHLKLHVSKK